MLASVRKEARRGAELSGAERSRAKQSEEGRTGKEIATPAG